MNSLPTELNLTILHHVRDSTPTVPFGTAASAAMQQANAYNEFLLLMALYHRHWTALAQSELFHHIILKDGDKTRLLLKLLKASENDVFRTYAEKSSSIRLGYYSHVNQHNDELKEHLDELAEYCPNIVEISCACFRTKFSDFQNVKRLDKLNFYDGSQHGSGSCSLSITQLSMQYTQLPTPLNPASFPFLRHLSCDGPLHDSLGSIFPLLPQIQSLRIGNSCSSSATNRTLSVSTSLATISIWDLRFGMLNFESHNIIKERLEVMRIRLGSGGCDLSKLVECIAGSKALKKVILDGLTPTDATKRANRITELKRVVEACKKKKTVELWKENFTVNGKVDLNADVAMTFDLA